MDSGGGMTGPSVVGLGELGPSEVVPDEVVDGEVVLGMGEPSEVGADEVGTTMEWGLRLRKSAYF